MLEYLPTAAGASAAMTSEVQATPAPVVFGAADGGADAEAGGQANGGAESGSQIRIDPNTATVGSVPLLEGPMGFAVSAQKAPRQVVWASLLLGTLLILGLLVVTCVVFAYRGLVAFTIIVLQVLDL